MPRHSRPRHGSLQFYPRSRARKVLPSVNWRAIPSVEKDSLLGFIAYKAGMVSVSIKDNTENSLTQKKKIIIPATVLEVPNMKVYSVRFYKNRIPVQDVVISNDKELKRILKAPKKAKEFEKEIPKEYDDIRVILYSLPKQARIKKTPDIVEVAISAKDKLAFVKSLIGKEISLADVLNSKLVDVKGLTKGKGFQGPVKRFGIFLRHHKSEKGVRKVGSIAPWHPPHVSFRTPIAGQMGYATRLIYNQKVIFSGAIKEKDINPKAGFKHYGKVNTAYLIIKGSVPGPAKRQLILTPAQRPHKKQSKQNYEFLEVLA